MECTTIKRGLDIPLTGSPLQVVKQAAAVAQVALLGNDYIGLKPSMCVEVGDRVAAGQTVFVDKRNPGVRFTAPASGMVTEINRAEKRRFESMVIRVEDTERLSFAIPFPCESGKTAPDAVRGLLVESGLWVSFRTRPYGKIPPIQTSPAALFVTAMDSQPLAGDPEVIIGLARDAFICGLQKIQQLALKTYLCLARGSAVPGQHLPGIIPHQFAGPHPAGLPSTHIHFLDPIGPGKVVWHIDYQDVIAIGHLFKTGSLPQDKVIALTGPAMKKPRLIRTLPGASIDELCKDETISPPCRLISGSVLSGHHASEARAYLGRYHHQITALPEQDGSGLLNWLRLGRQRFSSLPVFFNGPQKPAMTTAAWGGRRAIFPLGTYEKMMPLDIVATSLLKSLATGNTEKAMELGCMELTEEDLALCSFVCPGKNNFGPMLREVLTKIEEDG